ncbi:MAG TPA: mycofactocin biosynthesis peptidyl-dipeptidase MftE [Acidimicrobiales bacterium]|nr:mycofactocin biosynthesis peptidyl-dipeptidase MftE [Acidimicrobiales bacterium]
MTGGDRRLDTMTWPDAARVGSGSMLVVPLGSTEQHGPHLPLSTDTDVAIALCERLAARRPDVVVAPALPYGSSGEHADFAGTVSIGASVLQQVIVEIVRSVDAFGGVVLVSGHGGNAAPLAAAVATARSEGRHVLAWSPHLPAGDSHAGHTETSLLLALRPSVVRTADAKRGNIRPLEELLPQLRQRGLRVLSPNGVLGDPSGASAEEGAHLLDALADQLAGSVEAWWSP